MSNFKFLQSDPSFAPFMEVAMSAEKILHIDPAACILNCRRSMEFAVKWMYSVDKELEMPYQDNLQSLMTREEFRSIVGPDIWRRMDFIRINSNHTPTLPEKGYKRTGKDLP
jgi:type I restriction enzyme R subunit